MKTKQTIVLLFTALLLASCSHSGEVKEVTQDFFRAVKNGKESEMAKIYPNVSKLENYMKSDTISIKNVESLDNDKYSVELVNKFTNGFGKTTETEITVYLKPKNAEKLSEGFVIYDSKGLCDLSDESVYKYAKKTGIIKSDDLTDQQNASKLATASAKLFTKALEFKSYLEDNVVVGKNWSWETNDYSWSASGRGVVKNNTPYSIPKLKYIVTFKTRSGEEVTQEDGYVSYDDIRPYGSESFSFYSSYVGHASTANIRLEFDEEFILETVASGEYK